MLNLSILTILYISIRMTPRLQSSLNEMTLTVAIKEKCYHVNSKIVFLEYLRLFQFLCLVDFILKTHYIYGMSIFNLCFLNQE